MIHLASFQILCLFEKTTLSKLENFKLSSLADRELLKNEVLLIILKSSFQSCCGIWLKTEDEKESWVLHLNEEILGLIHKVQW